MKIAVCLHGLSTGHNSKGDPVSFLKSYDFLKKNIIDKYDADVYIHTWADGLEHKENLEKIYNPTSLIFEKKSTFGLQDVNTHNQKIWMTKSRWYSYMKSIELKIATEKETGINYDFVLATRFDNVVVTPFDFSSYKDDIFYSAEWDWPHNETGFLDYWFLSSTNVMDKFHRLYESIDEYISEGCALSSHVLSRYHVDKLGLKRGHIKREYKDFCLERHYSQLLDKRIEL